MRLAFPLMALLLTPSCASLHATEPAKTAALCSASERDRTDHARALVQDGVPVSQVTGARLLVGLHQGCEQCSLP